MPKPELLLILLKNYSDKNINKPYVLFLLIKDPFQAFECFRGQTKPIAVYEILKL